MNTTLTKKRSIRRKMLVAGLSVAWLAGLTTLLMVAPAAHAG